MDKLLTVAPVAVSCGADAEFVDFRGLAKVFGIRRSLGYALIEDGSIKSVVLRRKGTIKGKRLINAASVRQFLASRPSGVDPQLSKLTRQAQIKSTETKREKKMKSK